jgi:hypothetical protein
LFRQLLGEESARNDEQCVRLHQAWRPWQPAFFLAFAPLSRDLPQVPPHTGNYSNCFLGKIALVQRQIVALFSEFC